MWHRLCHIGSTSRWRSWPRIVQRQHGVGAVLVAFFMIAVFVMLLTVEFWKVSRKEVGGFPLRYCSKDVQKSVMDSWVMSLST